MSRTILTLRKNTTDGLFTIPPTSRMKMKKGSFGRLILLFDAQDFKRGSFPNLKPSVKSISIRLPEDMLAELKILANKKDVPFCGGIILNKPAY